MGHSIDWMLSQDGNELARKATLPIVAGAVQYQVTQGSPIPDAELTRLDELQSRARAELAKAEGEFAAACKAAEAGLAE